MDEIILPPAKLIKLALLDEGALFKIPEGCPDMYAVHHGRILKKGKLDALFENAFRCLPTPMDDIGRILLGVFSHIKNVKASFAFTYVDGDTLVEPLTE